MMTEGNGLNLSPHATRAMFHLGLSITARVLASLKCNNLPDTPTQQEMEHIVFKALSHLSWGEMQSGWLIRSVE